MAQDDWVAYNAIDELKRLEPELDHLREVGECADCYVGALAERDHGGKQAPVGRTLDDLIHAVNEHKAWEQDL